MKLFVANQLKQLEELNRFNSFFKWGKYIRWYQNVQTHLKNKLSKEYYEEWNSAYFISAYPYDDAPLSFLSSSELIEKARHALNVLIPDKYSPYSAQTLSVHIRKTSELECDEVISKYYEESIQCAKIGADLAAFVMLGCASEKAINILIEKYTSAIADIKNQERFLFRVNKKVISKKFDEFIKSYKSCKSRPHDDCFHDIETKINEVFQYIRLIRNDVGHPRIIPNIDKTNLFLHISNFSNYLGHIYKLIWYFENNNIET